MSLAASGSTADPNWLLSTVVQSGAALVAIIGGLFTSRLVSLSAERAALLRRLREEERIKGLASEAFAESSERLDAFVFDRFLVYAEDKIYEAHGDLNRAAVEALVDESGWDVAERDVSRLVDELLPQIRDVFQHLQQGAHDAAELERLVHDPPTQWADVDVQKAIDQIRSEVRRSSGSADFSLEGFGLASPDPAYAAAERQTRDRRLDDLEQAKDVAAGAVRAADVRVDLVERALDAVSRPPGAWRTLRALGFLSVACLVFPLVVMGFAPTSLPIGLRATIVVVFLSGLGVFFAELAQLIRRGSSGRRRPRPAPQATYAA
jgi:hypothetical protein